MARTWCCCAGWGSFFLARGTRFASTTTEPANSCGGQNGPVGAEGSAGDQLGHGHPECLGEFLEIYERNIPLAPFEAADICAVHACQLTEFLLRDLFLLAYLSDTL